MPKIDHYVIDDNIYEIVSEIAPLFNTSTAYAVGDYVIKDAVLYRFKTAHAAGKSWKSTEVVSTTVANELKSLRSAAGL